MAAAIVQPFVSEENHWKVKHHAIFQRYFFFHFLGLNREMREKFRGHPHFEKTEEFCRLFDQAAFDPNFRSMPLEAFEAMLQKLFREPRQSIDLAGTAKQRTPRSIPITTAKPMLSSGRGGGRSRFCILIGRDPEQPDVQIFHNPL